MKRKKYVSWDDFFMGIAMLASARSKDPSTQTGACICNAENRVLSIGYNGFPNGCSDEALPWKREGDFLDTKYPYVCHSELNAILNSTDVSKLKGSTIYSTLFPCNECTKSIIQVGIKKIVYLSDKHFDNQDFMAAKPMLDMVGIKYEQYKPHYKKLTIDLESGEVILEK